MEEVLEIKVNERWEEALDSWNHPSIPDVIAPKTREEILKLGNIGLHLQNELAFMSYPEFQTYLNLENVVNTFTEDPNRGIRAVSTHEVGHRFCPYDVIRSIILRHNIKKALESKDLPYDKEKASDLILNLFTDTCINTKSVRSGDKDIPWIYQKLSKDKKDSKLWRVYGKSMGLAWKQNILTEDTELNDEELNAAQELANLFEGDFFDKDNWSIQVKKYAGIISNFLEDENKDKGSTLDDLTGNIPKTIDENTARELAKRLAEIGSNGLPTNPSGLKEFKEIMAGFGQGDPVKASIAFYDMLSSSYDVTFATKPFGRPRNIPFQPVKWQPSMGVNELDFDYSIQLGGKIIPGVNTYSWTTRKREVNAGLEEVIPNLDLYIDSSGSMPNPVEEISLPVLAGFVVAKKANRKGASIRATNFGGEKQYETQELTRDLNKVFEKLVIYYNSGTVFPIETLLEEMDPKQVLIITDTFLFNEEEASNAISQLKRRNKGNNIAIYALNPVDNADYLRNIGAQVIHGTTTDIFKRVIGKADEVYKR